MKRRIAQKVFLGGMTGAAMLLAVGTAHAVEFKFGEANLQIDNLVSVGAGLATIALPPSPRPLTPSHKGERRGDGLT